MFNKSFSVVSICYSIGKHITKLCWNCVQNNNKQVLFKSLKAFLMRKPEILNVGLLMSILCRNISSSYFLLFGHILFQLYLLTFIYLNERHRDTERDFYLFNPQSAHNSWDWASPKPDTPLDLLHGQQELKCLVPHQAH